jgi:hypothetical protein
MVSIISFIKANLQHSSAASRILTRRVSIKGIDMVLIEEPLYCKGPEYSKIYSVLCRINT